MRGAHSDARAGLTVAAGMPAAATTPPRLSLGSAQ
jgi:hypothetical protein